MICFSYLVFNIPLISSSLNYSSRYTRDRVHMRIQFDTWNFDNSADNIHCATSSLFALKLESGIFYGAKV
jgi:hypothetical protein